jgi:hypothetical protein
MSTGRSRSGWSAAALGDGRLSEPARPLPALELAERHGPDGDTKTVLRFFS